MTKSIKFPECVYLGEYNSNDFGNIPAYLPSSVGGFCLTYQPEQIRFANHQIENTVLCLLEDAPSELFKIYIFDYANRPNFPFLAQLKANNQCQFVLNEQTAIQAFNELENIIQHRYHSLFGANDTCLNDYNARSPRPESYYTLIINTAYFPSNTLSTQRLKNFVQSAYDAGVYIIALYDKTQQISEQSNLKAILDCLPNLQFSDDYRRLYVDETLLPVAKMAKFDFYFNPADINQTQIIQHITTQPQSEQTAQETDFLNVKIGTQPNGDDAYFSLGKASMNYHAMLLGVSGSGKSTLMNNIILQIAKHYTAQQVRLYLMDYKQGVEFNQFKNHPNVEKIFLQSNDISAGIAMLEQLSSTIEQRYELFKAQQVLDIESYNQKNPTIPIPYILLMIDEFHKLLEGNYRHNESANQLLANVAKLGRASGVHLFLCTQSLKGVNINNALKDQIGLRMTYKVVNEAALGYDIFHPQNTKTIVALNKYQVLLQTDSRHALTAFVDKPQDIDTTINQIRLSRPPHLQVQAQMVVSNDSSVDSSVPPPKPATDQQTNQPTHTPITNPIAEAFAHSDNQMAQAQQKLTQLNISTTNDDNTQTPNLSKGEL